MNTTENLEAVRQILETEQGPLGTRAQALADVIGHQHGDKVKALLFYGSSLRAGETAGKMLDFYVLVDSYKSIYGNGLKRLGAFLAPPGVHYCEADGPGGERLRSKYSIVSLKAFNRRARGAALESMLWARFSQPTVLVCEDKDLHKTLITTLAHATRHFLMETAPLIHGTLQPTDIWVRGLRESYRTELRPEDSDGRSRIIVDRNQDRYAALSKALFGYQEDGTISHQDAGFLHRNACRLRWFARRIVGKPMGAFRVLKAFFTFDDGLNYILEKIKSHSGVEISLSERERKHPLLFSPILAWRFFRKGAFR